MTLLVIFPRDPKAAILATPAIEALRAGLGPVRLVGVFSARAAELFRFDDRFHALAVRPDVSALFGWAEIGRFVAQLQSEHGPFEWVINLDPAPASTWLTWRLRANRRATLKKGALPPFGWQQKLACMSGVHHCKPPLDLVEAIVQHPFEDRPKIASARKPDGKLIGLCPGAGAKLPAWGVQYWAECALNLSDHAPLALFVDQGGQAALERIESVLLYNEVNHFECYGSERSLQALLVAIGRLRLFVGEDGLLAQMAMAVGVPTVIIDDRDQLLSGPFCNADAVQVPRASDRVCEAALSLLAKGALDPVAEKMA